MIRMLVCIIYGRSVYHLQYAHVDEESNLIWNIREGVMFTIKDDFEPIPPMTAEPMP